MFIKHTWSRAKIKQQITMAFLALIMMISGIYLVSITCFLPGFYQGRKESAVRSIIEMVEENSEKTSDSDFLKSLQQECAARSLSLTIYDEGLHTVLSFLEGTGFAGAYQRVDAYRRSGREEMKITILADEETGSTTLEAIGRLENGRLYAASTSMEQVGEAVEQATIFLIWVMLLMLPVCVLILVWVAEWISRPIMRLAGYMKECPQEMYERDEDSIGSREITELEVRFAGMQNQINEMMQTLETKNGQLEKSLKEKEALNEARKNFFSAASHELKTPVSILAGYADLITESRTMEEAQSCARSMEQQTRRLSALVNQLLEMFRLENGHEISKTKIDLTVMLDDLCDPIMQSICQKRVRLVNEPLEKEIYDIFTHETTMEHILSNYLTNASDFVSEGGEIRIGIDEYSESKWKITVFNTGEHISPEDMEHLWDKFYRADKSRARRFGGTGLGLSIVRAGAESMHEAYGVQNVEGGVEFFVTADKADM